MWRYIYVYIYIYIYMCVCVYLEAEAVKGGGRVRLEQVHQALLRRGRRPAQGVKDGRCQATWTRKLPWREAGSPDHHDDLVYSDQKVVNKELSLCTGAPLACETAPPQDLNVGLCIGSYGGPMGGGCLL